jgi:hypothetical protein
MFGNNSILGNYISLTDLSRLLLYCQQERLGRGRVFLGVTRKGNEYQLTLMDGSTTASLKFELTAERISYLGLSSISMS